MDSTRFDTAATIRNATAKEAQSVRSAAAAKAWRMALRTAMSTSARPGTPVCSRMSRYPLCASGTYQPLMAFTRVATGLPAIQNAP